MARGIDQDMKAQLTVPALFGLILLVAFNSCDPGFDSVQLKGEPAIGQDIPPDPVVPDERSAYATIQAESHTTQFGSQLSGGAVGYLDTGDYLHYKAVSFDDGAKSVSFAVAVPSTMAGKKIEVRLDGKAGPLVGYLVVQNTGGWSSYQHQAINLTTTVTGVRDLYLVMSGGTDVANIDSFVFSKQTVSTSTPTPTPEPTPTPLPQGKSRWFPGHYMQATDNVGGTGMAMSKRALVQGNPNFVGYQVSIYWGTTELYKGDYSALNKQLTDAVNAARADGKKLWLRLFERSFHGTSRRRPFPQYITDGGGDYHSLGGENIWAPKLWEPWVKERFLLWAEKVAEFAAKNPEIVLISNEEYIIQGAWQQPGYSAAAFDQLWRDFAVRLRAKTSDCLIHINTGWSTAYKQPEQNKKLLDILVYTHKVGIGPTDLRKDGNSGSATLSTDFGSFMYNSTSGSPAGYQGQAFYAINYEWPDYNSVESPLAHLQWAYDTLKVHFIGWDPDPSPSSGTKWNWNHSLSAVNSTNGLIRKTKPLLVP